jgi:hypothetical protein
MVWGRWLCLVMALAACSSIGETATTPPDLSGCVDPPTEEMERPSALDIMVDPNPANARQQVDLMVTSAGLPADALAGVDAAWQCWDGSRWVTTHIVYRGFGDNAGQTIPVNADFQIRVPSIGLELDRGYPMVIPVVGPGIYRIEDEIIIEQGAVPGHVIVEVHED